MIKDHQSLATYYLQFNRTQWTALQDSVPLSLSKSDLVKIKEINENLSIDEVTKIYLPLLHVLEFYISSNLRQKNLLQAFLGTRQKTPYIIGITGSVAVGKSTIARLFQILLGNHFKYHSVDLIATDGFLHPNKILNERGLMKKKGFPQSYDMRSMETFVSEIKSGTEHVMAPIYSHILYDIVPDAHQIIEQPDILILEGLNILQNNMDKSKDLQRTLISDFVDFSIYVDAPEIFLKNWYINRFQRFYKEALSNPDSYFYNYSKFSKNEVIDIATQSWNEINVLNLKENILPTRERANLIMTKNIDHVIDGIFLKK